MKSPICEMFDIEFPMLAFSHCRDVVSAVSKAGGNGSSWCSWSFSRTT